jgi:hypothetical protein
MSTNPKLDRSFTYDSVNIYYTFKIARFGKPDDLILPTIIFESPMQLCTHLETVASSRGIKLDSCTRETPYVWSKYIESLPETQQHEIWKYREYVYACSVLFIGHYIQNAQRSGAKSIHILPSTSRHIPDGFTIDEHTFTIVGSSELMSDIDITIQGPRSSFLISLLEDLYIYMSYTGDIPIRCWDVEFYGDFKLLQSLFVNMNKFTDWQRLLILKYALMSYFRSSHKDVNNVHPLVIHLVNYCLKTFINTNESADTILRLAHSQYAEEAPDGVLNREYFYKELREVEVSSLLIKPYLKTIGTDGKIVSDNTAITTSVGDPAGISFTMFSGIMRGNLHRAESYVVPSTAVHVVEFEQKKAGMFTDSLPESWLSSNARIGIDTFGFIVSAIEQLGYLEHYHEDSVCNKKGIKYFGRLARALVQAGLLQESSQYTGIAKQLNMYRGSADPTAVCGQDIHQLLEQILNTLQATVSSTEIRHQTHAATRRRRRFRKTMRRYDSKV